ncbi:MAG: hypothetical protein ACXWQO_08465 [Bdellovibrionota bacterium]
MTLTAILIAVLLASSSASAANCSPSEKELAAFSKATKVGVVYEPAESMMLNSNFDMDLADLMKEAKKKNATGGCLIEALALIKSRPWLKEPAIQEALKYFYCEGVSSASFVLNVQEKKTATAFVRVNLSSAENFREFSLGGRRDTISGGCQETFLGQIRENTAAAVESLQKRNASSSSAPAKTIQQSVEGLSQINKIGIQLISGAGVKTSSGTPLKVSPKPGQDSEKSGDSKSAD